MNSLLLLSILAAPPQAPPLRASVPPQAPPVRTSENVRDTATEWVIVIDGREFRVPRSVEKELALKAATAVAKQAPFAATPTPRTVATVPPKRVIVGGKYYDQYADGALRECVECNRR